MRTQTVLLPRPLGLATDFPLTASAGFLATLAIATTMYLLPALGLPQVDLPIWVGRVFTSAPVGVAALGLAVHFVVGFAFAWLYTARVEPRLALSPTRAGAAYGLLLWVFAQAIAVPALGLVASTLGDEAAVSPGLLSYRLGAGAALGSLASHVSTVSSSGSSTDVMEAASAGGQTTREPIGRLPGGSTRARLTLWTAGAASKSGARDAR